MAFERRRLFLSEQAQQICTSLFFFFWKRVLCWTQSIFSLITHQYHWRISGCLHHIKFNTFKVMVYTLKLRNISYKSTSYCCGANLLRKFVICLIYCLNWKKTKTFKAKYVSKLSMSKFLVTLSMAIHMHVYCTHTHMYVCAYVCKVFYLLSTEVFRTTKDYKKHLMPC